MNETRPGPGQGQRRGKGYNKADTCILAVPATEYSTHRCMLWAGTMTQKTKGRVGCHQATPRSRQITAKSTGLASRFKAVVVTLALWGVLPAFAADWIICWGGLRNE